MNGPHPSASALPWLEDITHAYARYLGAVLGLRPNLFVRQGNLISWLEEEPPAPLPASGQAGPRCRSCGKRAPPRRVLCARCQRCGPVVFEGARLATAMYRSCHPDYDLDESKKETIKMLLEQISAAKESAQRAHDLSRHSYDTYRRGGRNVQLTAEFVGACSLYDRQRRCGDRAKPVLIGGLGIELRGRLVELAEEWLVQVDERVRRWFGTTLGGDDAQQQMVHRYMGRFADMLANHASLLEVENAPRDEQLCVQAFEHVAESLFKFDSAWAQHWVERDCAAMTLLKQLALAPEPGPSLERRDELLRVLKAPPPELLALMPNVANDLGFDALCCAIGVLDDPLERGDALRTIEEWRANGAVVGALGVLLDKAIDAAGRWRMPPSGILHVLQQAPETADPAATSVQLQQHPAAMLPPVPWARGTGRWQLRKPEVLRHKRMGLRDANLRVALLCAVLVRLLGSEAPRVLVPGRVASDVLCNVCNAFAAPAQHAVGELQDLLEPLTRGVEFGIVARQLNRWRGSHLEDDVRAAARHLSRYSLQEIEAVFGPGSGYWSVGYNGSRLLELVEQRLVFKTEGGCVPIVAEALSIGMELIGQYRTQMLGWSPTARASRAGDLLRLLPSVDGWLARGGDANSSEPLQVGLREAREAHDGVRQVLEHLSRSGLVARRRVGTVEVWQIAPDRLAALLAPRR